MTSYYDAIGIILSEAEKTRLGPEKVSVNEICGRVAAVDIRAAIANQPFDNSAMDGFALNTDDLQNAANDNPIALEIAGHIAAGDVRRFGVPGVGRCYEIMTGAPLPQGCDAVVPVEKTEKSPEGKIVFRSGAAQGDNIRRAGSDFKTGDVVLERGVELTPAHVLALATLGIGHVQAVRRAKIALISTGQEVIDKLGAPLEYGQIYNSTKPYLISALTDSGITINDAGTMRDDPVAFRKKLQAIIEEGVDLCISTGAVSAGVHDFVPSVLKELGAEIFFHKVSIRPGKPVLFAKFPGKGPFYAGLPGNPAATAAGLRFFVTPLLRAMQGLPREAPRYAILKNDYNKGDLPLRFFMRAMCTWNTNGVCEIEIQQKQQSFMVSPFAKSNAWAVIPEDVAAMKPGELVEFYQ